MFGRRQEDRVGVCFKERHPHCNVGCDSFEMNLSKYRVEPLPWGRKTERELKCRSRDGSQTFRLVYLFIEFESRCVRPDQHVLFPTSLPTIEKTSVVVPSRLEGGTLAFPSNVGCGSPTRCPNWTKGRIEVFYFVSCFGCARSKAATI